MKEKKKKKQEDVEVVETETMQEAVEEIVEEVEVLEESSTDDTLIKAKQEATENFDKYQRCLAEFDNFRKRTMKEKAELYDNGVRDTIEKLLLVGDNLERAMSTKGEADEEDAFVKGVKMTLKQYQEVMESIGVTTIKAVGETFNPELHAAVAHEDDDQYGQNEIIFEMLKGYEYKGKVIRHSMVKVVN